MAKTTAELKTKSARIIFVFTFIEKQKNNVQELYFCKIHNALLSQSGNKICFLANKEIQT